MTVYTHMQSDFGRYGFITQVPCHQKSILCISS